MPFKRLLGASLLFALLAARPSGAEGPYTIREAVELGLRQNQSLKAAESATEAAREDIGIARSRLLPRVTLEERYTRTNNPTFAFSSKLNQERFSQEDFAIESLNSPAVIDDFQGSLSFEQPVLAGKASRGLSMAKTEYGARRADLRRRKEELAYSIGRAFLAVDTSSALARAAERTVDEAKERLRVAEARGASGLGLHSDVLRARTALVSAEQRQVTAVKNLALARRSLGMLLGMDSEADIAGRLPGPPSGGLEAFLEGASARSDIKSMELRRENARANIGLARAGYLPTAGIGGTYFVNDHESPFGAEGQSWQAGAFVRWDLFDGGLRSRESAKAAHLEREASAALEAMRLGAAFKVQEAWLGVEEARKNMELAEAALRSAEEGVRLVRLRFENSLTAMVDLLDAEASLEGARAGLVMRTNEYSTALLTLVYESGGVLEWLGAE